MNTNIFQGKSLSFNDACAYLGYSKSYMYKLTMAKIVPHSKPNGGKLFFQQDQLDEWKSQNQSSSLQERQINASTYVATHKAAS